MALPFQFARGLPDGGPTATSTTECDGAAVPRRILFTPGWFGMVSLVAMLLIAAASRVAFGDSVRLDAMILTGVRRAVGDGGAGSNALRSAMLMLTALGAFPTLAGILLGVSGFLIRAGRRDAALRLMCMAGSGMLVANLLKHLIARERPAVVAHWTSASGSSFPSGHSADSAIVYLLLAGLLANGLGRSTVGRRVQAIGVSVILLVGVSRIYLGVHWPTDVLGGWAFGGGWAFLCAAWPGRVGQNAGFRIATFSNVVVYPTQELLKPPFVLFRGGPDWPLFWFQVHARHSRFALPVPLDVRPRRLTAAIATQEPAGIWCGPISQHFGHAIASFGSRIPASSRLAPDLPLVFSARPGELPPPFFGQILSHFGVNAARVRIVSIPTTFRNLLVVPQGERLSGGGPSRAHLDMLDLLNGPSPGADGSMVYVSRAGMWKGRIAGELYLERQLERAGFLAFRPEEVCLDEQLAVYRRASKLLFAEGSALHALQLVGRIPADVTVIVRRNGRRLAQAALRPRASSLTYIDAVEGLLRGLRGDGRPQPSAGLTIINDQALVEALEDIGVQIGSRWDRTTFLEYQAHDLKVWVDARRAHPLHRGEAAAIRRSLSKLGMGGL